LLGVFFLRSAGLLDPIDQPGKLRSLNFGRVLDRCEIEIIVLLVDILHIHIIVDVTDQLLGEKVLIEVLCLGGKNLVLGFKHAGG
jgi:hypothetical protein